MEVMMRQHCLLGILVLSAFVDSSRGQDSFPVEKTIVLKNAEVRAAPTESAQATSRLTAGDKVIVLTRVKDNPSWFAIAPPAGSFSWVKGNAIKVIDKAHAFILYEGEQPVDVFAGSRLDDRRPDSVAARLTRGTTVIIVDRPLTVKGETWYPIVPHPSEVRYIHESAIKNAGAAESAPTLEQEIIILCAIINRFEHSVSGNVVFARHVAR
jgi:hypothetical protein